MFEVSWKHLTSTFKPKLQLYGNRHASSTQPTSLDHFIVTSCLSFPGNFKKHCSKKNKFMVIDQCPFNVDSWSVPVDRRQVWHQQRIT